MDKFSLEVYNWTDWELERDFSTLVGAKQYGMERLAHNEWRVFDRISQEVVYRYDPTTSIEQSAGMEVRRFQAADAFRTRSLRTEANLAIIAARQRHQERVRREQRAERLRGFRFVGEVPDVMSAGVNHDMWTDAVDDIDRVVTKGFKRMVEGPANWLREGF